MTDFWHDTWLLNTSFAETLSALYSNSLSAHLPCRHGRRLNALIFDHVSSPAILCVCYMTWKAGVVASGKRYTCGRLGLHTCVLACNICYLFLSPCSFSPPYKATCSADLCTLLCLYYFDQWNFVGGTPPKHYACLVRGYCWGVSGSPEHWSTRMQNMRTFRFGMQFTKEETKISKKLLTPQKLWIPIHVPSRPLL
jgi:hypothetical protein